MVLNSLVAGRDAAFPQEFPEGFFFYPDAPTSPDHWKLPLGDPCAPCITTNLTQSFEVLNSQQHPQAPFSK